jgi:hypothetical protein
VTRNGRENRLSLALISTTQTDLSSHRELLCGNVTAGLIDCAISSVVVESSRIAERGGWYAPATSEGTNSGDDANVWKCGYHKGRALIESVILKQ